MGYQRRVHGDRHSQTIIKLRYTMKPTLFAAIVLISFAVALSAPAPLLPVVVSSGSVVAPSIVLASGTGIVPAAALLGAKKLAWLPSLLPKTKALLRDWRSSRCIKPKT